MPKVDASTMDPATWEANPAKEWCPPGHGDLYAALSGSGKLDQVRVFFSSHVTRHLFFYMYFFTHTQNKYIRVFMDFMVCKVMVMRLVKLLVGFVFLR